jgi:hypothetical protein
MACCARCFSNPHAQRLVWNRSKARGDCDYCERRNVKIVPEVALRESFQDLVQMYGRFGEVELGSWADGLSPGVDKLVNLLQDEWNMFDDELHQSGRSAELLDNILGVAYHDPKEDPGPSADDLAVSRRRSIFRSTPADLWYDKRQELLKRGARLTLGEDWTDVLMRAEARLKRGSIIYRARIGYREHAGHRRPLSARGLGPPPPEKTPAGRANVKGRPVFYAADDAATAIAEVRPAIGNYVSVGTFRLKRTVKIVDVVAPLAPPNPFSLYVGEDLHAAEMLEPFGKELGLPLTRTDQPARDYKASQVICRTIRSAGYFGVRYPSAMTTTGRNVVLFDPRIIRLTDARLIVVTDVRVTTRDFDPIRD